MPYTMTKFRYLLILHRIHTGEQQYVVAGMTQIHPTIISHYAQGKRAISSLHMIKLCNYLKVNPEDLVGEITIPTEEYEEITG